MQGKVCACVIWHVDILCFYMYVYVWLSSDCALKHPLSAAECNSPVGER